MQAYEGYLEKGQVYPMLPFEDMKGRRRVIITVLDEPIHEKTDTWAELDKIVGDMKEKPRLEDFPRCDLGRDLLDFDGV